MTSSWKSVVLFAAVTCAVSACGGDDKVGSFRDPGAPGKVADGGGPVATPGNDAGVTTPGQPVTTPDAGIPTTKPDAGGLTVVPPPDSGVRPPATTPATPPVSTDDDDLVPGTASLRIVNQDPDADLIGIFVERAGNAPETNYLDGERLEYNQSFLLTSIPCEVGLDITVVDENRRGGQQKNVALPCDKITSMNITP